MKKYFVLIWFFFPGLLVGQNLTLEKIFHEPYLPGITPLIQNFTPDQNQLIVSWNEEGKGDRSSFKVSLSGGSLSSYEDDVWNRAVYAESGDFFYVKDNALWVSDRRERNVRKLVESKTGISSPRWSFDESQIAFVMNGDIWVANTRDQGLQQITRRQSDEPAYSISTWTGNGNYLVALQYDTSEHRDIFFPTYVGKFVEPGLSRRGQAEVTVSLIDLETQSSRKITRGVYFLNAITASRSGNYLAVDRFDRDMKTRELTVHTLSDSTKNVVFSDSTEGWIYPSVSSASFAPNADKLMFTSEATGFSHIYTINPDGSNKTQHTSGDWEVPWLSWKNDQNIVFASTEEDPGVRHLYLLDTSSGSIRQLTEKTGFRRDFRISPDRSQVVYLKTYWNTPFDVYRVQLNRPRRGEQRVTSTVPERFSEINWIMPEYHRIPGRDGETTLSMRVLRPANFEEDKKYPVVVFAHGAGSLQNVYKGWSYNYWREYMFDQFLAKDGYVAVEVDFRHSTGYGRKFREDITNWMGKYETEDIVDGLRYLDANYGYVDLDRVGIYGGSYGGFMALYAVSAEPDYFHAGAALRKVTNWVNYYYANPWYTRPRLGTPEEHPEHYERSSPLNFADSLQHPVLLLHGLVDDNVGFQDAMQYVDRLIKSGNTNFELMVYPSENHGFTDPNAWFDEYYRMYHFFERHVRNREVLRE